MGWLLVASLMLIGCGDEHGPDDLGAAARLPFPQVTPHGSQSLANPLLVTITYSDELYPVVMQQFGDFLVASDWLLTVGKEYGVVGATHTARSWGVAAPPTLTAQKLISDLKSAAMSGALPKPTQTIDADAGFVGDEIIYLVYVPTQTLLGEEMCSAGFYGYHFPEKLDGVPFVIALVSNCSNSVDDMTAIASHEVIESATDPDSRGWYLDVPASDPWFGMNGAEVGDLCSGENHFVESTWALQRSWSNAAAKAGGSPCVPTPHGEVYYNIAPDPPMPLVVAGGKSATFTITGWAQAALPPWTVTSVVGQLADFDPMVDLPDYTTLGDGRSITVKLKVPPGTASGRQGTVQIYSSFSGGGHFWPLTVIAQ
jgi:hypothetical protein